MSVARRPATPARVVAVCSPNEPVARGKQLGDEQGRDHETGHPAAPGLVPPLARGGCKQRGAPRNPTPCATSLAASTGRYPNWQVYLRARLCHSRYNQIMMIR